MYKLLVLDMDGTLLKNDKKISEKNIQSIKKAKEKGVKIVLASGRTIEGIELYLKELDLLEDDEYSITLSGGLVLNNTKEKIVFENEINHNSIMEIYNLTRKLNTTLNAVSRRAFISPEQNFYTTCEAIENRLPFEVKNFEELKQENIYKINLINEDKIVQEEMSGFFKKEALVSLEIEEKKDYKKNLFGNLDFIPEEFKNKYSIMKTTPYTLEVIHKDTNKGIALEKLANYLGIKRDEIIAIGDSGNDEHMIEYAGLGIAMGNAFKSIKEKADFISLTNQEDGVAYAINKFILN